MNKREKNLLIFIILMVVIGAHFWGAKVLLKRFQTKDNELLRLTSKVEDYRKSGSVAAVIAEEVEWLQKYEPKPSTSQETLSELQAFLMKSASELSLTPYGPKLFQAEEEDGYYRHVKVQVSAKGTEEQIYRWITAIHQPRSFRAITYMKVQPATEDDQLVVCTIVADQWLVEEIEE